jgi:hypothetical protein
MIKLQNRDKYLEILGDGQIWDVKGILPFAHQKTFEDLFSGRALGEMAQAVNQHLPKNKRVFSLFKEKGKITGFSVTKALLSNNREAKKIAISLLDKLAKNAALGIKVLTKGRGFKENWSNREKGYWRGLNRVIIGGGASEGLTGKTLIRLIKKYLSQNCFSNLGIYQAKFPGKEAGFLGAALSILEIIFKEAKQKKLDLIAVSSLDLGREEIGVGLLAIRLYAPNAILKRNKHYWFFKKSIPTARRKSLEIFLDSRQDYTQAERARGERIRTHILGQMTDLIACAQAKAKSLGLPCSENIAVAVPGRTSDNDYIIDSTDYLPFFRKKNGFNLARALERLLFKKGLRGYHAHIINDGIAAGIANIYFNFPQVRAGEKIAFLGVGSGLGGCLGRVGAR